MINGLIIQQIFLEKAHSFPYLQNYLQALFRQLDKPLKAF